MLILKDWSSYYKYKTLLITIQLFHFWENTFCSINFQNEILLPHFLIFICVWEILGMRIGNTEFNQYCKLLFPHSSRNL